MPGAHARRGPRCPGTLNALPPCDFVARTVVTSTAALGAESAGAADDVAEFLEAEVAGEARLGDDVVGQLERDAVGEDRVVAVRDVAERSGVDQHRLALERLHEVRLIASFMITVIAPATCRCSAVTGCAVVGRRHDDPPEPLAQILQIAAPARTPPSPPRRR